MTPKPQHWGGKKSAPQGRGTEGLGRGCVDALMKQGGNLKRRRRRYNGAESVGDRQGDETVGLELMIKAPPVCPNAVRK